VASVSWAAWATVSGAAALLYAAAAVTALLGLLLPPALKRRRRDAGARVDPSELADDSAVAGKSDRGGARPLPGIRRTRFVRELEVRLAEEDEGNRILREQHRALREDHRALEERLRTELEAQRALREDHRALEERLRTELEAQRALREDHRALEERLRTELEALRTANELLARERSVRHEALIRLDRSLDTHSRERARLEAELQAAAAKHPKEGSAPAVDLPNMSR
jgi:chromosome segregation ATPase